MWLSIVKHTRGDMGCYNCDSWLPHIHYPFIGYCTVWGQTTFEDYYCSRYSRITIANDRFYWCATCKVRITKEEALAHWSLGHRVVKGAYVDPDVREEIYEG